MKKITLMFFVSLFLCSTAYADETIQLAAVMTDDTSNIQANQRVYASDGARSSGGVGAASSQVGFEFGVIAGVVVAATVASIAEGSSNSTSNH